MSGTRSESTPAHGTRSGELFGEWQVRPVCGMIKRMPRSHPGSVVSDPELPALEILLGPQAGPFLDAVLEGTGSRLRSYTVSQVRFIPSKSVTVQYRAKLVSSTGRPEIVTFVATSGVATPDGVPVFAAEGLEVAFWQFPNDPFLPGLASAADPDRVSDMLGLLGAPQESVTLSTRAYRPGSRAVVEASGKTHRIFLKIVRPGRTAALQQAHTSLAQHVPVPHSYGWSGDLGVVALQAMPGRTLRAALTARSSRVPTAADLVALLDRFPQPAGDARIIVGPHQRAVDHARLLDAVAPELATRVGAIVGRLDAVAEESPIAVHGDFHSSQVLVNRDDIVGLVDVDTAGVGERANDLANIVGHLGTLALDSPARRGISDYGGILMRDFDKRTDPVGLRLRVSAVILGLATGPFRVQEGQWPKATERRVALAESWITSADEIQ